MKNISYNYKEKRYIGRKQIKKFIITVKAKTQLECKKKLTEAINNYLKTNLVKHKNNTICLSDFWNKWYSQDKEPFISERTKEEYMSIKSYLSELMTLPINKLTKDLILNFFKHLPDNRVKEKMNLYLNSCLKSAVKHDIIKKNPYDLIILAPRQNKHKQALTYIEQKSFLQELSKNKVKIIAYIYLLCGLRKKELNFKSIENDINFETLTLKAINLKGRNKITRYKHIRITNGLIKLIMNNLDIIHSYDCETAYKDISKIMKDLNIKKSIVNLRHTFATNHLYLGTPDYVISKEMGHSTSQITKDNYMDIDFNLTKDKIIKLYNNLYPIFL